jgi:hypothetical protein
MTAGSCSRKTQELLARAKRIKRGVQAANGVCLEISSGKQDVELTNAQIRE